MANDIVEVNVTQTVAPQPSTLQRKGAFVSQGATTLASNATELLVQSSDLASILQPAKAITSLAWNAQVVTVATAAPHGFVVGKHLAVTIAGATPAGYNGTFLATVTGASALTYPLASNPGAETVPGTYILAAVAELASMNADFYDQGSQQAVYVLELGPHEVVDSVAALAAWLITNPKTMYAFLVPRAFADESTYEVLVNAYTAPTGLTYFFTTVSSGNYGNFSDNPKSVVGLIQSPDAPVAEFTLASWFWDWLHTQPSSTTKVPPAAFTYLFGVTAYPSVGNAAFLATLKAAFVNYAGTGAEGGISNKVLFWGTTKDGRDASYWYSIDWVQLNADQQLAAAVISGSNDKINPLYYNQPGVDRLQAVAAGVMAQAVSFGLALGTVKQTQLTATQFQEALENGDFDGLCVVNAVPFVSYVGLNPSDFNNGTYGGLTLVYTPNRGFTKIVVNLNVVNFAAQ